MLDAAHGIGIRTVPSIQRVHVTRVEVEVSRIIAAGDVRRRRPAVALRADVVQGTRLTVAEARRPKIAIAGMNAGKKLF